MLYEEEERSGKRPRAQKRIIRVTFPDGTIFCYKNATITFTEAVLGCKKEIPTIYGNVKLTVPAGTDSGDKQRLKGKGIKDESRRRTGDMYVIFKVITPKKLSRDQKKLFESLAKTDLNDSYIDKFNRFTKNND